MRWLFKLLARGAEPESDASLRDRVRTPSTQEPLSDWKLALSLVDREPHRDAVIERLLGLKKSGKLSPLLVIVPGYNRDRHWSLVMRCGKWDLRPRTGKDWEFHDEVKWPRSEFAHVLREVGKELGVGNATEGALNDYLKSPGPSLCLAHYVLSEDWAHDEGAALKEWVKLFADRRLHPDPERFVVASLCVQYWTDDENEDLPLKKACEEWSKAHESENSTILVRPRLELVDQSHLRDWRKELSRKLDDPLDSLKLEIEKLFLDQRKMHMERVHSELRQPLIQVLPQARPRPEIVRLR
jgi:hypothetical protein